MSQMLGWRRRRLDWLTQPCWSRLDGVVLVFLALAVAYRPGWWPWLNVGVVMVGLGFMTTLLRRAAGLPRE